MTKYFCDRCGKETTTQFYHEMHVLHSGNAMVNTSEFSRTRVGVSDMLCESCEKEFCKWLRGDSDEVDNI